MQKVVNVTLLYAILEHSHKDTELCDAKYLKYSNNTTIILKLKDLVRGTCA